MSERAMTQTSRDGKTGWFDADGRSHHVWMQESTRGYCAAHIYSPLGNGHSIPGQCSKPGKLECNGFKFCSIHYPPNVEKRAAERRARHKAENDAITAGWERQASERRQMVAALDAIRKIAAGHNDPRGLAMEVLGEDAERDGYGARRA